MTGLTEVTLRKVYKELLENWDDLLPSNYTPAVPPEKAFPTATIASGRSSTPRVDLIEATSLDRIKESETKPTKTNDIVGKEEGEWKESFRGTHAPAVHQGPGPGFWKSQAQSGPSIKMVEKNLNVIQEMDVDSRFNSNELEKKVDKDVTGSNSLRPSQFSATPPASIATSRSWPFRPPVLSGPASSARFVHQPNLGSSLVDQNESKKG